VPEGIQVTLRLEPREIREIPDDTLEVSNRGSVDGVGCREDIFGVLRRSREAVVESRIGKQDALSLDGGEVEGLAHGGRLGILLRCNRCVVAAREGVRGEFVVAHIRVVDALRRGSVVVVGAHGDILGVLLLGRRRDVGARGGILDDLIRIDEGSVDRGGKALALVPSSGTLPQLLLLITQLFEGDGFACSNFYSSIST
jgi:hypothetical protein